MTTTKAKCSSRRLLPNPLTPAPLASPFGAQQNAACHSVDSDMFFDDTRYGEAKAVCAGCPLRTACLAYALECEEFGVWGGATPEERTAIRGTQSVWTPEERLLAQELRDRLASGQPMRSVAEWSGVTERTLYRWVAEVESSAA